MYVVHVCMECIRMPKQTYQTRLKVVSATFYRPMAALKRAPATSFSPPHRRPRSTDAAAHGAAVIFGRILDGSRCARLLRTTQTLRSRVCARMLAGLRRALSTPHEHDRLSPTTAEINAGKCPKPRRRSPPLAMRPTHLQIPHFDKRIRRRAPSTDSRPAPASASTSPYQTGARGSWWV